MDGGSGDALLDRRYAWARGALDEGDAAAAFEILEQTLAQAPGFVAAWHLYGRAAEMLGEGERAASAWRECLALDADDRIGAAVDLARLGALTPERVYSGIFAAALFDAYADRFEDHLVAALSYDGPALIMKALAAVGWSGAKNDTVYDLGCGTGLMGEAVRPLVGFLAGCDVSARMLARARTKERAEGGALYDKLAQADLVDFLASRPERSAGLVLAADVFIYAGNLRPAFSQSARVLSPGGLLAFTTQSHDGEGVVVGGDRRFHHAEAWLREALAQAGLAVIHLVDAPARTDRGVPVPGHVVVARKA